MTLPSDARDKLAKLIPLLSSNRDGEVVAAARAIERTLKAAGSDLHDLAILLTGRKTGWVPSGSTPKPKPRPRDCRSFSYADAFGESERIHVGPDYPNATTRKFGLPIYARDHIEPWSEVARHILMLNRTVPKKHGGRLLQDWQKAMLKTFIGDRRQPTNQHVEWLERTIARLHQGRDARDRAAEKGSST